MTLTRLALVVVYTGYLVYAGLLMLILPWSEGWERLILRLPPVVCGWLDTPALRGLLSAFGLLHLALIVVELVAPPGIARRRTGEATDGSDASRRSA